MRIGVPREIKADENRVALLPVGAETLIRAGHRVLVETEREHPAGLPMRTTGPPERRSYLDPRRSTGKRKWWSR